MNHDPKQFDKNKSYGLFNKTFYHFVFSFVAVIAAVLVIVLVVAARVG